MFGYKRSFSLLRSAIHNDLLLALYCINKSVIDSWSCNVTEHGLSSDAEHLLKLWVHIVEMVTKFTPSRKPPRLFPRTPSTFLPSLSSAPLPRRCPVRRRICGRLR